MFFFESELFRDVQSSGIFADSKTFADAVPVRDIKLIIEEYDLRTAEIDLQSFVNTNFSFREERDAVILSSVSVEDHIRKLWPHLTRKGESESVGSRIAIPHPYVVPGGRFDEMNYWDSYFTMLGLAVDGRIDLIRSMIDNFTHQLETHGFIPNGNRSYFLSRSQPPFFSLMVRLLMDLDEAEDGRNYLNALMIEYSYWTKMSEKSPIPYYEHKIDLQGEGFLARYWDNDPLPRPESFLEDLEMYADTNDPSLYRNLRSACESGWDFSSRWCKNPFELASIRTIAILPVDLNALIYGLETLIAELMEVEGDQVTSDYFSLLAEFRTSDIIDFCYEPEEGFFFDYDFLNNSMIRRYYASGIFPLFMNMVEQDIAEKVADRFMTELVVSGGVLCSQIQSGQQWDAPFGWAPLNWIAYKAMRNYGFDEYAEVIRLKWMTTIETYYQKEGRFVEKYNVLTTDRAAVGEYAYKDGYGWTNGVYMAMKYDR